MLLRQLPANDPEIETAAPAVSRASPQMPRCQRATRRDALCKAATQTGRALSFPFHLVRGLSGGGDHLLVCYNRHTAGT